MAVVSAFAQTLRRYTSLNHLAQAARAVLQNTSQINQMLSDLNRVDFANVQVHLSDSFPGFLTSRLHCKITMSCCTWRRLLVLTLLPFFHLNGFGVCLLCLAGTGIMGVSV